MRRAGTRPTLKPDDYAVAPSLVETWSTVEGHMREFLAKLKDEDLPRIVEFKNSRGELRAMALGELMQHAANHGVHHLGQVRHCC